MKPHPNAVSTIVAARNFLNVKAGSIPGRDTRIAITRYCIKFWGEVEVAYPLKECSLVYFNSFPTAGVDVIKSQKPSSRGPINSNSRPPRASPIALYHIRIDIGWRAVCALYTFVTIILDSVSSGATFCPSKNNGKHTFKIQFSAPLLATWSLCKKTSRS